MGRRPRSLEAEALNGAIVDTNVLVRAATRDDERQAAVAEKLLKEAERVVIGMSCLCEFAWVLSRAYKHRPRVIAATIRRLVNEPSAIVDRPVVEAGLAALDAGGDFADGVIAFEGRRMGGDVFVSFDRDAVKHLESIGAPATLLR